MFIRLNKTSSPEQITIQRDNIDFILFKKDNTSPPIVQMNSGLSHNIDRFSNNEWDQILDLFRPNDNSLVHFKSENGDTYFINPNAVSWVETCLFCKGKDREKRARIQFLSNNDVLVEGEYDQVIFELERSPIIVGNVYMFKTDCSTHLLEDGKQVKVIRQLTEEEADEEMYVIKTLVSDKELHAFKNELVVAY
mgnify:CR=1 FL=1